MAIEHDNDFKEKNRSLEHEVTLEVGDVEIGAVEVKDGETDARQAVETDGAKVAGFVQSESLASEASLAALLAKVSAVVTTIGDGRKIVAAPGTAEALVASTTPCKGAIITALSGNTDTIVVGASTVVAALATRRGTPIEAGDSFWFPIDNLTDVYVDAEIAGEGVSFTYFN